MSQAASTFTGTLAKRVLLAAVLVSFALRIGTIVSDPSRYQWDMRAYYKGGVAFREGQNPYDTTGYIYPPIHLATLSAVVGRFEQRAVYGPYLLAKVLCFGALIMLWRKMFALRTPLAMLLLVCWVGFNAAAPMDITTGNVSVCESLLLYVAFLCYVRGKMTGFALLILAAASIKLSPMAFLVMLLVPSDRHVRYVAFGIVGFVAFALANVAFDRELTMRFLYYVANGVSGAADRGYGAPSSLAFLYDILSAVAGPSKEMTRRAFVNVIYLIVVSFVCAVSWWVWSKGQSSAPEGDIVERRVHLVVFTMLAYVLIVPRMKEYSYVMVVPAALWTLERYPVTMPRWLPMVAVAVLPIFGEWPRVPIFSQAFVLFWNYYALWIALCLWLINVRWLRYGPEGGPAPLVNRTS